MRDGFRLETPACAAQHECADFRYEGDYHRKIRSIFLLVVTFILLTTSVEKLSLPDQKGFKSTSSLYRKQTYTAPSDSLNYDDDSQSDSFGRLIMANLSA